MSECPGGDVIMVAPGFWRINNKTDEIFECYNRRSNCLGGNLNFCEKGYLGALCE